MHRNTLLIPVFKMDFWVDLLVECVFYPQDAVCMVRTNLLLCQIDLETYNFYRYLTIPAISLAILMSNEGKTAC